MARTVEGSARDRRHGVMVACGGDSRVEEAANSSRTAPEQMQKAAEQTQGGAEQMAKGFESMAKGLSAMAGGDPNAKPVDPVSFRELMAVFPESFPGGRRSKPTGERMSSPVNFSQAEVQLHKGRCTARTEDHRLGVEPDAHRAFRDDADFGLREGDRERLREVRQGRRRSRAGKGGTARARTASSTPSSTSVSWSRSKAGTSTTPRRCTTLMATASSSLAADGMSTRRPRRRETGQPDRRETRARR